MKKFSFKFESLLNIRSLQEEEAERNFQEAVMNYQNELETLDGYRSDFAQTLKDLAEQRRSGFDARIQQLYDNYFKHLKIQIAAQTKVVDKAEQVMEEKRELLIEAMKERKVVEKMKMKEYENYMEELKRWEQSIIDDLTVLRQNSELAVGRKIS